MPQHYHPKRTKRQTIYRCECGGIAIRWESGCWQCAKCAKADENYRQWRRREAMRGMKPCTVAAHGRTSASWEF